MSMMKEAMRAEETKTDEGRTVAGIVNSIETLEGGGFLVRRPFPKAAFSDFDPFLLLDEMGPMNVGPGEAKGAPDHPHRGLQAWFMPRRLPLNSCARAGECTDSNFG